MNFDALLDYFDETERFKQIQEVICTLCGSRLEVRSLDGRILNFHRTSSRVPEESSHTACPLRSERCDELLSTIIEKATAAGTTQVTKCAAGMTKILIPVSVREEIMAYLIVTESQRFKFNSMQVKAIIDLLEDFVQDIDKNELMLCVDINDGVVTYQRKMVNKVVEYLKKNYHQPELSLKKVSDDNGISYHYLSRLFKKELRKSFTQYLNQIRLDVATRLLENRSLTVSEVAYTCGYEDPGYFCKIFKRTFGQPPGHFRCNASRPALRSPATVAFPN